MVLAKASKPVHHFLTVTYASRQHPVVGAYQMHLITHSSYISGLLFMNLSGMKKVAIQNIYRLFPIKSGGMRRRICLMMSNAFGIIVCICLTLNLP